LKDLFAAQLHVQKKIMVVANYEGAILESGATTLSITTIGRVTLNVTALIKMVPH
jgi:hypothetical protein